MLQTSFVRFFRVRLTSGKLRSPKRMVAFLGAARMRTMSALVGSHSSQTMFFEKSLLEKGTADECEHTVARRMGDVNPALETCGLRQNARKLVILPTLRRTVENRQFSRSKQEYQIKASHRFLGIVYPVMLSMGAEIDRRIWATNRTWRVLYGMWWKKRCHARSNGRSFVALCAEPPSRASLHFFSTIDTIFVCRGAWKKSSARSCSERPHGKDKTT